jgi:hypothetical protein
MIPDDVSRKLEELRTIVDAQSDLIAYLISQSTLTTARLEVCTSLLGDILAKHGIEKAQTRQKCEQLFAQFVAVAHKESAQALSHANDTRPPSVSGPDAEKNRHGRYA